METWTRVEANRAHQAEKGETDQPSLKLCTPHFYPDSHVAIEEELQGK